MRNNLKADAAQKSGGTVGKPWVQVLAAVFAGLLTWGCLEKTAGTSSETEVGDIALVIETRDELGNIVPGTRMTLKPAAPGGIAFSGMADSAGRLSFDPIPVGEYYLLSESDSIGSLQMVEIQPEDTLISDTLYAYGGIEGQIEPSLLESGNTLTVNLSIIDREIPVNADGSFSVRYLPEFTYTLEVEAEQPLQTPVETVDVEVPRGTIVYVWLGERTLDELQRLLKLFNGFTTLIGMAASDVNPPKEVEEGLLLTGDVTLTFPFGSLEFRQANLTIHIDSAGNFEKLEGVALVPSLSSYVTINNPVTFTGWLKTGDELNAAGEVPFPLNPENYYIWVESSNPLSLTLEGGEALNLTPTASVPFNLLQSLNEELLYMRGGIDELGVEGGVGFSPDNGFIFDPSADVPPRQDPLEGSRYYNGVFELFDSLFSASGSVTLMNLDGSPVSGGLFPFPDEDQLLGFEGSVDFELPIADLTTFEFSGLEAAGYWEKTPFVETLEFYLDVETGDGAGDDVPGLWPGGYSMAPTSIQAGVTVEKETGVTGVLPQVQLMGEGRLLFPENNIPWRGTIHLTSDSLFFAGGFFQGGLSKFAGSVRSDSTILYMTLDARAHAAFEQSVKAVVAEGIQAIDSLMGELDIVDSLFGESVTLEGIRANAASWATQAKSAITTAAREEADAQVDAHVPSSAPASLKTSIRNTVRNQVDDQLDTHLKQLDRLIRYANSPTHTEAVLKALKTELRAASSKSTINIKGTVSGSYCVGVIVLGGCGGYTVNYSVPYNYNVPVFNESQRNDLARAADLVDDALELLATATELGLELEDLQNTRWDDINSGDIAIPQLAYIRLAIPHPGATGFDDGVTATLTYQIGSTEFTQQISSFSVQALLRMLGESALTLPELSSIIDNL